MIEHKSATDKWVKCISSTGTIRAVAVTVTDCVNVLAKRHQLPVGEIKPLAEGLVASLILSSYCKSGEKINLNIQGSGVCTQAIIDANADGKFVVIRGHAIRKRSA